MGLVKSAEEILAEIGTDEDESRLPLTQLQRELVDAIAAFAREFGYWPMCEELTGRLGILERIVAQRVRTLRQKGYVEAGTRGLSQGIRLAAGVRDVGTVGSRPGPPAPPCRSPTHSRNAYANGHCRCPIGRAAHAEHCRRQRANRRARADSLGSGDPYVPNIAHGLSGYREHGCRCTTCRRAHELEPLNRAERVA